MIGAPRRLYKRSSLLGDIADSAGRKSSLAKCLGCGNLFKPNSARQTHYCSAACGDRARNNRKRDRRLALRRNIEILDALKIPVGHSKEVDLDELCKHGFDPDVYTDCMDILLSDGITRACRIYMERYLIQNHRNTITIKHL